MPHSSRVAGFLSKSIDASIRVGHSRPRLTSGQATTVRQRLPQENHVASAFRLRLYHEPFKSKPVCRGALNSQGTRDKTVMADVRAMPAVRLIHCERRSSRREYGDNDFAGASPSLAGSTWHDQEEEEVSSASGQGPVNIIGGAGDGTVKQASLQEVLGITDAEAETLRGMATTSGPGFNNLVAVAGESSTGEGEPAMSPSPSFATYLLDNLRVKPKDVKALVLRRPRVLSRSTGPVGAVAEWLQGDMNMSQAEVARLLLRFPEAGSLSVENNLKPTVAWFFEELEADSKGVAKILWQAPQVLGCSIEGALEPRLRWLEERLQIPRKRAAKMARSVPRLLIYSAESKLEPTLLWLQKRLGIEDESEVFAMVTAAPTILCMNVKTGLEPKLAWLRDRLGLTPEEICRMVRSHPPVLVRSVEKSLEPKVSWLRDNLGLSVDDIKVMFLRYPTVTGAGMVGNLELKLPWLQTTFGFSHEEAVVVSRRAPVLLILSIKGNLEPTVAFFRREMKASDKDLRSAVFVNPNIMSASLEGRLRPRVATMKEAGIEPLFSKYLEAVVLLSAVKFRGFIVAALEEGEY